MNVRVCLPGELGPAEIERWLAIRAQRPDLQNPFLSPSFAIAVGRARPSARVAVIEEEGRIVGFWAFERRAGGLAVPIGAGMCDCQGIVHEPDLALDVRSLLAAAHLSAWRFDHLISTEAHLVEGTPDRCPAPYIDLTMSFQDYLKTGERRARTLFQSERKMGREIGPVRFTFNVDDDHALDQLLAWKSAQYGRTGRQDRFANKANVQLIRELAQTRNPDLSGTLTTVYAGDRLAAAEFDIRSETVLAGWFPAHDCDLSLYSPGSMLKLHIIQIAGDTGLRRFEMGKGEEPYKQRLKTHDSVVCDGWMVRPCASAYLRRASSMPREALLGFVLGHDRLRRCARSSLKILGGTRMAARRIWHRPPGGA